MDTRRKGRDMAKAAEDGAVLVVVMSMILLLTILSLSAMSGSNIRERMAGNERDQQVAFQAAEAGLRDAESYMLSAMTPSSSFVMDTCTSGLCGTTSSGVDWYDSDTTIFTDSSKYQTYGTGTSVSSIPSVASQPRYIIEQMPSSGGDATGSAALGTKALAPPTSYRVTVKGYGARTDSISVLQSIFIKPAN